MHDTHSKPTVIITGSSGLIGRTVIDALKDDYQIIGFDKVGNPQPPQEVECICVDLTNDDSVQRGLKRVRYAYGERIASVIHLAAYYDFSGEPSPLYEEVTVKGTARLLRNLQDFDVEQFVFSSTMLVHKPTGPGKPINEEAPLEGKWEYPQSKIKTENVIEEQRGSIPAVLLRIAGVYTDDCGSIPLAQQIDRIYQSSLTSHVFPGDTSHGQSFVHLDDVIDAIARTVKHRKSLPDDVTPILIGEPEVYSYQQIQQTLGKLIHNESEWMTEYIPKSVAESGAWVQGKIPGIEEPFIKPWMIDMADDHYEIDISRAEKLLGWKPRHRLIDTLPKMMTALKNDPVAWYKRHNLDPPSEAEEHAQQQSEAARA